MARLAVCGLLLLAVALTAHAAQQQSHHHQQEQQHHQQQQQQQQHHVRQRPSHQRQVLTRKHNRRLAFKALQHPDEQVELIGGDGAKLRQRNPTTTAAATTTTRLRRISARDYYNNNNNNNNNKNNNNNNKNVAQRRHSNAAKQPPTPFGSPLHADWGYHNYNVHTNTYGQQPPTTGHGKGDDNTHDVEFISGGAVSGGVFGSGSSHPNSDWPLVLSAKPRRGYDYVPPPPLVPPTATATATTTTTAPPTTPPPATTPPTTATGSARRVGGTAAAAIPITTTAPATARRGYGTTSAPLPAIGSAGGSGTSGSGSGSGSSSGSSSGSGGNEMPPPATHVTEDPFAAGDTIGFGKNLPTDPKEMERRHICVQQRTITMPVKTTEVYTRPIWKHIKTPCQMQTHVNQMCTRVQIVHEQAFRDVIRHKAAQQVTTTCCSGWTRDGPFADACMKPVCTIGCQNGGTCTSPDTCSCPAGFGGRHCEHDVNECKEEKPCDQTCINTFGSYYCKCREGFLLQPDQQSCKKIDLHEDDAFEARDLENEIEPGDSDVSDRLHKIERSLANERVQAHELQKTLQATYNVVDTLKSRLTTLEKQQQDLHRLQTNLYATETRTNKLEGMVNLLMKCRNAPNAYCP